MLSSRLGYSTDIGFFLRIVLLLIHKKLDNKREIRRDKVSFFLDMTKQMRREVCGKCVFLREGDSKRREERRKDGERRGKNSVFFGKTWEISEKTWEEIGKRGELFSEQSARRRRKEGKIQKKHCNRSRKQCNIRQETLQKKKR